MNDPIKLFFGIIGLILFFTGLVLTCGWALALLITGMLILCMLAFCEYWT